MKNNYIKYIYTLLAFTTVMVANAQVVFNETFGTSTVRTTSQYVPQGGVDALLGNFVNTCSSFYSPAISSFNPIVNCAGFNNDHKREIANGYYTVIDPASIPANTGDLSQDRLNPLIAGSYWKRVQDHTPNDVNGAVLIVNGGTIKNQYYRRGVTLKYNTSYKLSYWVYGSGNSNGGSFIEVQNVTTETILAKSDTKTYTQDTWTKNEFNFKTPTSTSGCNLNIAVALRNAVSENSGNDFYIDDIILEEVIDPSAPVITCNTSTTSLSTIMKANDDVFGYKSSGNVQIFNVLLNDLINNLANRIVVSGDAKNATISQIGTWPSGISINSNGEVVIAPNTARPTSSLQYQICNYLGVCSVGTIQFYGIDLAVELTVTNPSTGTDTSNHTYTLKITNKGGESITLSPSNKINILVPQANGATGGFDGMDNVGNNSGTLNGWNWSRVSLQYDYTFTYPGSGTVTLQPGEEKQIQFSRSYLITPVGGTRIVTATTTFSDENSDNNQSTAIITKGGGGISTINSYICAGSSVTVNNDTHIVSGAHTFEISYDNGISWIDIPRAAGTAVPGDTSITFNDVTSNMLIRRKVIHSSITYYSNVLSIKVQKTDVVFPNGINTYYQEVGTDFIIPDFASVNPELNITYFNNDTQVNSINYTNLAKGDYYITIKGSQKVASLPNCEYLSILKLIVYDLNDCNTIKKKTFANHAIPWNTTLLGIPIGGVTSANKTIDGDPATHANLNAVVNLLGIGTLGVDLHFKDANNNLIDIRGKKIVIKLGEQYSGLKLAGGISVVGRWIKDINTTFLEAGVLPSSNYKLLGKTEGVKGGVLDLLKGDNVFEFTYVPELTSSQKASDPNQQINGVRIQTGSLLGVADLATVFHAYIEDEVSVVPDPNNCSYGDEIRVSPSDNLNYPSEQKGNSVANTNILLNQFSEDVTWGNYTEVLNVASSLSSVVYPYYAIDNNYNSYAMFNTTVGVLNKQFLKVNLRQIARPGDQVQITLGTENVNILNLGLLNLVNYKIKYFLGDAVVGEQTLDRFKILDLGLLNFSNQQKVVISTPIIVPFDRIQLEQWNTVNVNLGNQLYIYDIRLNPQMLFVGQSDTKNVTDLCANDYLPISKMDACTSYKVSFSYVTEYGNQLRDENGNLMVDKNNKPILSIKNVQDIANSDLGNAVYTENNVDYYDLKQMHSQYKDNLLVKIQTIRLACNYGDAQYLRVNLENCDQGIVNPIIKLGANY